MKKLVLVYLITNVLSSIFAKTLKVSPENCKIWGPGLTANKIVLPARYFYIQSYDKNREK
jgi:hypothetical protein